MTNSKGWLHEGKDDGRPRLLLLVFGVACRIDVEPALAAATSYK